MYKLVEAGVRVPKPYGYLNDTLIMELVTDAAGNPAPRLGEIDLSPETAREYHHFLIQQVVRMLSIGFALLRAIDGYAGREVIGVASKLALLFFVRPGELRKARWEQFDFERAQLRIPAKCMKARVQHLVPLSRHALELLRRLHVLTGSSEYLFPLIRDTSRPLHGAALSCAPGSFGVRSHGTHPARISRHRLRAAQ